MHLKKPKVHMQAKMNTYHASFTKSIPIQKTNNQPNLYFQNGLFEH